ncbi:transporter substrate-binding domain-containing protein [Wielerella bovis]|uniref:transporter substrate-binding domain-containing protein n=1 Tax=Wielerella bovis TaxID=2917790 RepID=UPI002019B21D|nr:transporter substrate-binding domain-containing protein [Wielerella bovis]ULJ65241.1 transporter substrate-binding domain-containing protein [Wielerella bovis]ULJ67588.1 transporter substrate-binding domain-containing protein [Wielerella bovis]
MKTFKEMMNKMKKLTYLTILALGIGLSACSGESTTAEQNTTPATPNESVQTASATNPANPDFPTYMVGSEVSYEPFEFKDEKGHPMGFEVELLQEIGKAAQFNVVFIHTPRNALEADLNSERFSILASALSVSLERMEKMDFSEPFLDFVREVYILDTPENAALKSISDLNGKRIAVNGGSSTAVATAQELAGSADRVEKADSFYLSLAAMYNGKAIGTLGDSRILQYYDAKTPEIKTRAISLGDKPKYIAFAVKKGNTELRDKINQGLKIVKENGTYDQLLKKWFNQDSTK